MSLSTTTERTRRPAALAALALTVASGTWTWATAELAGERFAGLHMGGLGLATLALVGVAARGRPAPRTSSLLFGIAGLAVIAAMGSGIADLAPRVLGWAAAVVAMGVAAMAATAAADVAQNRSVSRL